MARRVHSEGVRERQNMRDAARHRSTGDWMVIAELPNGREVVATASLSNEGEAHRAKRDLKESRTAGYQNSDLRVARER